MSPPRSRKLPKSSDTRQFSWATQRIHDLERELKAAKERIVVRCDLGVLATLGLRGELGQRDTKQRPCELRSSAFCNTQ